VAPLGKTDVLKTGWAMKGFAQTMLPAIITAVEAILLKTGKPMTPEKLWGEFLSTEAYGKYAANMNVSVLVGIMRMSEKTAETVDGMWGLSAWPTVIPKRIRDKVFLILEKTGKPICLNHQLVSRLTTRSIAFCSVQD
jgi:hypothetical protein